MPLSLNNAEGEKPSIARVCLCAILAVLILLNMLVIFLFSAEDKAASGNRSHAVTQQVASAVIKGFDELTQAEQDNKISKMELPIRKLAHFSIYALLGFLCGALAHAIGKGKYAWRWIIPAAGCFLYAISDEVHQIFSHRGASPVDVMIDFIGALFGLCFVHGSLALVRRMLHSRTSRKKEV